VGPPQVGPLRNNLQCLGFQKTAERLVSKYTRGLLLACSSMVMLMMTTLCAKAVGQLGNGINAGKGF